MTFKRADKFETHFVVDEKAYNGFLNLYQDRNPLHVNDDFAKELGFREKVMHGNILNGFLSFFVGECLPIKNVVIHSQSISFKLPVYLNNKLRLKTIVDGVYDSVEAVEFKYTFSNEAGKTVAKGKIQIGILK